MAHFLSEVTHLRLELREDDVPSVNPHHIVHTHDFTSLIRCVEVVPTLARGGAFGEIELWTGDTDGTLTVRQGIDGRPSRTIPPQVTNVFIYCLQYAQPLVWAGRSDGFVDCYDVATYRRTLEMKAHGGSVNVLLRHKDFMLSGGSDWQLLVWDAVTCERLYQFANGHTNGVRCLIGDGAMVFSGGDDGAIHCWDLETTVERAGGLWPVTKAHTESVRALAVHEVYLCSCSNDGSLRVWNTQTAQLVRIVDQRACAINSIFTIHSTAKLWSAAADGTICVWDIPTMTLVTSHYDHRTTNVPLVKCVARVNSLKLWTLTSDGNLNVWYSDTDPGASEFEALENMEIDLQTVVDEYRRRIVFNYQQLERCKEQLLELERRDASKKVRLALALEHGMQKSRQNHVLWRLKAFAIKRSYSAFHRRVASIVEEKSQRQFGRPFFQLWLAYTRAKSRKRLHSTIESVVTQTSQHNITMKLLWQLADYSNSQFKVEHGQAVATHLATANRRLLAHRALVAWERYAKLAGVVKQQRGLVGALASYKVFHQSLASWTTTVGGYQASKSIAAQNTASRILQRCNAIRQLQAAYLTWSAFLKRRAKSRKNKKIAQVLAGSTSRALMMLYLRKWACASSQRRLQLERQSCDEEAERIVHLTEVVERNAGCTEAALEDELHQMQLTLARVCAENEELDDDILRLTREKRVLQRELLRDTRIDRSAIVTEQLEKSVYFLKARGVSSYHDMTHVEAARNELRTSGASKVMKDGIMIVRKVFAACVKPQILKEKGESEWLIGDLFSKIKRKRVEKANAGLVWIVVAFDSMTPKQLEQWTVRSDDGTTVQWDTEHSFANEVTANLGALLELALRSYRYHRGENPNTGEPVKKLVKKTLKKTFAGGAADEEKQSRKPKRRAISKTVTANNVNDAATRKVALRSAGGTKRVRSVRLKKRKATFLAQGYTAGALQAADIIERDTPAETPMATPRVAASVELTPDQHISSRLDQDTKSSPALEKSDERRAHSEYVMEGPSPASNETNRTSILMSPQLDDDEHDDGKAENSIPSEAAVDSPPHVATSSTTEFSTPTPRAYALEEF